MGKITVICNECENVIELDDSRVYEIGDIIECPHCGSELEVVNIKEDGTLVVEIIEEEK